MARILIDGTWYEQIEPSTFSEQDLEDRIVLHAPSVYPDFYVIPFKQTVSSEYGDAIPDLAFVARGYQEWWVVEIEMGYHDLNAHVEPQVRKLASAAYGAREAVYLCGKMPALDVVKTTALLSNVATRVLVITNEPRKNWVSSLSRYGATLAVFELFRSDDSKEIFRVNGQYPSLIIESMSECFFHPTVKRFLGIRNPSELNLPLGQTIALRFNNCITEWKRIDAEGTVWLSPEHRSPLNTQGEYSIHRQSDGSFVLVRQ